MRIIQSFILFNVVLYAANYNYVYRILTSRTFVLLAKASILNRINYRLYKAKKKTRKKQELKEKRKKEQNTAAYKTKAIKYTYKYTF